MILKKKIIIGAVILILAGIFIFNQLSLTGKTTNSNLQQVEITPLSAEERNKVVQTVLSSEFIKDVPNDNPIVIQFYDQQGNERVWRDGFLLGENQFLSQGEPTVYLYLPSRYIQQINNNNICSVVKEAKNNGELGFYSDYNKARLLIKYAGMLKHRGCFGF